MSTEKQSGEKALSALLLESYNTFSESNNADLDIIAPSPATTPLSRLNLLSEALISKITQDTVTRLGPISPPPPPIPTQDFGMMQKHQSRRRRSYSKRLTAMNNHGDDGEDDIESQVNVLTPPSPPTRTPLPPSSTMDLVDLRDLDIVMLDDSDALHSVPTTPHTPGSQPALPSMSEPNNVVQTPAGENVASTNTAAVSTRSKTESVTPTPSIVSEAIQAALAAPPFWKPLAFGANGNIKPHVRPFNGNAIAAMGTRPSFHPPSLIMSLLPSSSSSAPVTSAHPSTAAELEPIVEYYLLHEHWAPYTDAFSSYPIRILAPRLAIVPAAMPAHPPVKTWHFFSKRQQSPEETPAPQSEKWNILHVLQVFFPPWLRNLPDVPNIHAMREVSAMPGDPRATALAPTHLAFTQDNFDKNTSAYRQLSTTHFFKPPEPVEAINIDPAAPTTSLPLSRHATPLPTIFSPTKRRHGASFSSAVSKEEFLPHFFLPEMMWIKFMNDIVVLVAELLNPELLRRTFEEYLFRRTANINNKNVSGSDHPPTPYPPRPIGRYESSSLSSFADLPSTLLPRVVVGTMANNVAQQFIQIHRKLKIELLTRILARTVLPFLVGRSTEREAENILLAQHVMAIIMVFLVQPSVEEFGGILIPRTKMQHSWYSFWWVLSQVIQLHRPLLTPFEMSIRPPRLTIDRGSGYNGSRTRRKNARLGFYRDLFDSVHLLYARQQMSEAFPTTTTSNGTDNTRVIQDYFRIPRPHVIVKMAISKRRRSGSNQYDSQQASTSHFAWFPRDIDDMETKTVKRTHGGNNDDESYAIMLVVKPKKAQHATLMATPLRQWSEHDWSSCAVAAIIITLPSFETNIVTTWTALTADPRFTIHVSDMQVLPTLIVDRALLRKAALVFTRQDYDEVPIADSSTQDMFLMDITPKQSAKDVAVRLQQAIVR